MQCLYQRASVACLPSGRRSSTALRAVRASQAPVVQDRRTALIGALSLAPALLYARPASAGAFGDWVGQQWKQTQKQHADLLIAPIKASQQRLGQAMAMLTDALDSSNPEQGLMPVLQLVRSSSVDCYVFEAMPDDSLETKASLAQQRFAISDPCTFRLIIKNITTLSPAEERSKGETLVATVILNYQKLDGELEGAVHGSKQARVAATQQLRTTMDSLNELEQFVQGVLA